jgi:phosphoribulokinase
MKPAYDHRDGTLRPPVTFTPRSIVIVHGLVGLVAPELAPLYDLSVFLDPDPELRIQWKMQRDCTHRGYTPEQVREQLARRRADVERYLLPQRERADLVLQFYPQPGYWSDRDDARLDLRLVRRRPLAGADLARIAAEAERLGRRAPPPWTRWTRRG